MIDLKDGLLNNWVYTVKFPAVESYFYVIQHTLTSDQAITQNGSGGLVIQT